MTAGEGAAWWQFVAAGLKEFFAIASIPGAALIGGGVWGALTAWRKSRDDRADTLAKERRTEDQRRDEEWRANLERAGVQVQAHVKWQEERAVYAETKLRETEVDHDALREKLDAKIVALTEERWKLLGSLRSHRDALAATRRMANDLERKLGQELTAWHPLDEG